MIVDTSAVIAILRAEPDTEQLALAIERAPVRRISAANFLEAAVVIDSARPAGEPRLRPLHAHS